MISRNKKMVSVKKGKEEEKKRNKNKNEKMN